MLLETNFEQSLSDILGAVPPPSTSPAAVLPTLHHHVHEDYGQVIFEDHHHAVTDGHDNNNVGYDGVMATNPKYCWHDDGESLAVTVYAFLKAILGSGNHQGALDNRIEQAMDLVKSHLMYAVRCEVEELKDRIHRLEDTISALQAENDILRAHATPEALAQLRELQQLRAEKQQLQANAFAKLV